MILIKKDSTDVVLYFFIVDTTAFTPETGITVTDLDMQYTRELTTPAAKVDAIVGTGGLTTHVDDKIVEVDATSSPGLYMVCFPDAAFAAGADKVMLSITGAGFHPVHMEAQLVDFDPEALKAEINTEVDNALNTAIPSSPTADSINEVLRNQGLIVETGVAVSGTLSTTQMSTDLPASNNIYNGQVVKFTGDTTTVVLRKQAAVISAYDGATTILTFTALTVAPVAGDKFVIM